MSDPFAASGPLEVHGFGLLPPAPVQPPEPSPDAASWPPAAEHRTAAADFDDWHQAADTAPQLGSGSTAAQQQRQGSLQPAQVQPAYNPFSASGPLLAEEDLKASLSGTLQDDWLAAGQPAELGSQRDAPRAASEDSWGGFEERAGEASEQVALLCEGCCAGVALLSLLTVWMCRPALCRAVGRS